MLATLIAQLVEFLRLHPHIAYGVVFLLAMSESLPVVGAIVPGTAVIITLSTLVPSGVLVIWPLLAAATLGAIAGDGFAFWLGHLYHRRILSIWPFSRYPAAIQHSEKFFARYGTKSVFLARFLPGVRAFVPLLAGTLGMKVTRFYVVNVFSAAVWAPVHILPGVLFGVTFHALGPAAKPLGALLFTLVVLSWLLVHGIRYAARKGLPFLEKTGEAIQNRLSGRDDPASRFVSQLLDPAGNELRAIAPLVLILILAAWLFFGILEDVFSGDPLVNADLAIYHLLQGFRSYPSDAVMVTITELGDATVVVAMTIVILAYLIWARAKHTAIFFFGAVAGASLVNTAIKVALHRARPIDDLYTGWSAFSFPSGHSTVNMALYGALAILIALNSKGKPAVIAPIIAGLAIFTIAFSRLYLGAHWFSDVIGGMAFGLAWIALLGVSLIRKPKEKIRLSVLAAAPVIVLCSVGIWHVANQHAMDMKRYAVHSEVPRIDFAKWWQSKEPATSLRRIDLTGDLGEPFSLEWAGHIEPLQKSLANEGWQVSASWKLHSLSMLLSGSAPQAKVPVFPLLASGQLPDVILTHPVQRENGRLVMRIWKESLQIDGKNNVPLWKATITNEQIHRPFGLATFPVETGDGARQGIPLLVTALKNMASNFVTENETVRAYDGALN